MQLKELISRMRTVKVEGPVDREIQGISYDSRRVTPGILFVAVRGQKTDGHEYILSAIEKGASAIVCERNGFTTHRATKIKVEDTREALAQAASSFYQQPSAKLKVIAITGTNGKTTVSFLVKHILETAGIKTGLIGTIRYEIAERVIPAHRTTPEALEIQQMMAQMVRAGCQACVMEVSSHALEQKRVHGVDTDVAIFTNLSQDHLDYHGTMEAYFQAKKKLFTDVEHRSKMGVAVINLDDPCGQRLVKDNKLEVVLTYGLDEEARVRASQFKLDPDATSMVIETPEGTFPLRSPLIGRHNIYNVLAAVGAGLALKVDLTFIQRALGTMTPVPGRLEKVMLGQPFGVFVDYAHTDDALRNVLQTVREITRGRLLLTFGCGGNRDSDKRAKMGQVAAELADFSLLTSDNPRRESAADITSQIEDGFRTSMSDSYSVQLDRRRAIEEILRMARPGDSVVIAGKGHETYQEFEDTIVPFDDRVYTRETLETLGYNRQAASLEETERALRRNKSLSARE